MSDFLIPSSYACLCKVACNSSAGGRVIIFVVVVASPLSSAGGLIYWQRGTTVHTEGQTQGTPKNESRANVNC